MKKIISVLVALIIVLCGFAFSVNAAPSPEVDGVITIIDILDNEGNKAGIELVEIEKNKIDTTIKPTSKNETTITQYEVKIVGSPKYPVNILAEIKGVKSTSTVYILAKRADGTIEKIPATVKGDGKVELSLKEDYKILSVVVDKKTATSIGVSDKTGDNSTVVIMGVLCTAVALAVVSAKKVKA